MRLHCMVCLAVFLSLFMAGCGASDGGAALEADGTNIEGQHPAPAVAVFQFLEAVRTGNDGQAEKLLTSKALQKTQEEDLFLAPPGSDTASFEVGDLQHVAENTVHVASTWTDVEVEGVSAGEDQYRTDHITWILCKEAGDWRISGMIIKPDADAPPVVLDFENPQQLLQTQETLAEQEAQQQDGPEAQSAARLQQSPQTVQQ